MYLLDEPLSGLDAANRQSLLTWMKASRDDGVSFVVVEHDFRELLTLVDQALVLRRGEVTFCGPARDLCNEVLLADVYL
jgi:ABC-type multidrug transport system ATPase subunit